MLLRVLATVLGVVVIGFVLVTEPHRDNDPSGPLPGDVRPPARPPVPVTTAMVTTDGLNVRDGASLDAAVLDTLPFGAEVSIVGEERGGFTPVRFSGGEAWVATRYLGDPGASDAPPADGQAAPGTGRTDVVAAEPVPAGAGPVDESARDAGATDAAAGPVSERWIDVDRSTGTVTLREGEVVVATYTGRVGRDPSPDGFYSTAPGTYHVFSMNKALTETPFAEGAYLTDWVGFDPVRSNGFHSPVRDASGVEWPEQNATTLGCVRLDADAAVAVFDFAHIGMRVEIHD